MRLLSGRVTFKNNIIFDHADHLVEKRRGMKLRCTSCHSQIVQGPHMVVTEGTCFTCHFIGRDEEEGMAGSCLSCHGPPTKEVEHQGIKFDHSSYVTEETDCLSCHTNVTQGTGEVPPERCYSCHVVRSEQFDNPDFLHKMHVTDHKVECFECHLEIRHGASEEGLNPLLTLRCLDCHTNQHSVAEQMYSGVGVEGLPNTPSMMFLAKVNCNGCHKERVELVAGQAHFETAEASAKECVACHGEGYDEMMAMWQEMTKETLASVKTMADDVSKLIEEADSGETARAHFDKAVKAIRFVEADGSLGVHNLEYSDEALSLAETEIESAREALQSEAEE